MWPLSKAKWLYLHNETDKLAWCMASARTIPMLVPPFLLSPHLFYSISLSVIPTALYLQVDHPTALYLQEAGTSFLAW